MSWSIGYDANWNRDIGYGVPAYCDFPGCMAEIDRGLSFVCGGQPYGGELGCGLYFCSKHRGLHLQLCKRCRDGAPPFKPSREHPDWIRHKLTHSSWQMWRNEEPRAAQLLALELNRNLTTNGPEGPKERQRT